MTIYLVIFKMNPTEITSSLRQHTPNIKRQKNRNVGKRTMWNTHASNRIQMSTRCSLQQITSINLPELNSTLKMDNFPSLDAEKFQPQPQREQHGNTYDDSTTFNLPICIPYNFRRN